MFEGQQCDTAQNHKSLPRDSLHFLPASCCFEHRFGRSKYCQLWCQCESDLVSGCTRGQSGRLAPKNLVFRPWRACSCPRLFWPGSLSHSLHTPCTGSSCDQFLYSQRLLLCLGALVERALSFLAEHMWWLIQSSQSSPCLWFSGWPPIDKVALVILLFKFDRYYP